MRCQFYEFGAFQSIGATIDIWATNSTLSTHSVRLELSCYDLSSDWTHTEAQDAQLGPNRSTELLSIPCPCPAHSDPVDEHESPTTSSHSVVVHACIIDPTSGAVIARYSDWPQPYRHVEFPDPKLSLLVTADGKQVTISVHRPVKALVLSVDSESGAEDDVEVKWSDNALDVVPGDPQTVIARGLGTRRVKVAYMGSEQSHIV